MSAAARWAGLVLVVLLAGLFAYFNGGERVTLNLGFAVLYRISLVGLTFTAFLLGMVLMFLVGLRHDLEVRRLLREYRIASRLPEREVEHAGALQERPDPPPGPEA